MTRRLACCLLVLLPFSASAKTRVGVTLHPYYSWTSNVVAGIDDIEVVPIVPGEVDAGDYQPRPEDVKKLKDLDALVVNGIGHDDFIFPMLTSSGNKKAVIIRPNDASPQIKNAGGKGVNSHTFISFTNAIQQTWAIEKELAKLRPDRAEKMSANAAEYAKRLRKIKAAASSKLAEASISRVVTVHDGYGYLLQEFGLEVAAVVQPSHGITPSAGELADLIRIIRKEKLRVVLSEESFPPPLLDTLKAETGAKVYVITHIASGAYTPEKFENEMQKNADTLVKALVTDPASDKK